MGGFAEGAANGAFVWVMPAGRTIFPREMDDLEMDFIPGAFGEKPFQIPFGLLDRFAARKAPSVRAPMDVRVDGKGGEVEGLRQDDGGALVADAGELFEGGERFRDAAAVMFDEHLGELPDSARFRRGQAAGADDRLDLRWVALDHLLGRVGEGKKLGRGLVHPDIGALGRKEDRDEERVGVFVLKRDLWIGKEGVEDLSDSVCLLFFRHYFPKQNLLKMAERISSPTFAPMMAPSS